MFVQFQDGGKHILDDNDSFNFPISEIKIAPISDSIWTTDGEPQGNDMVHI